MRRLGLALTLLAAGAVAPTSAAADQQLQSTGSITYTWQGDPSHGCAAVGVCDVTGALIVEAEGSADLQRLRHQDIINLNGGNATVRVTTGTGASATECIDDASSFGQVSVFVRSSATGLVGTITPGLSSGRCAGPLMSDLSGLALTVRRSSGKHPSFDLRTTRTFAAGPYVGTLVSTVTMRPGPPPGLGLGGSSSSSSGSFFGVTPPPRPPFVEHVRLRYRVSGQSEPLVISFAGENDPFCGVLGSCGVSGETALSAPNFSGTLTLLASRTVYRRRDARQVIADLRNGLLRPYGALSSGLGTSETYDWPDGSRCQDSVPGTGMLTVGGLPPGGGLSVALEGGTDGADVLRTHCPGPSYSDAFASAFGQITLARAPITGSQLLSPQSTVTLTDPGDFSGMGYVGSRSGRIGVSLALEGIQAGTKVARR